MHPALSRCGPQRPLQGQQGALPNSPDGLSPWPLVPAQEMVLGAVGCVQGWKVGVQKIPACRLPWGMVRVLPFLGCPMKPPVLETIGGKSRLAPSSQGRTKTTR